MTMRIMLKLGIGILLLIFGCEAQTVIDSEQPEQESLEVKTFTTPEADSEFIYFSFSKGDTVTVATLSNWDIAFQRTTIKINGGTSGSGNGGAAWLTGVNFEDVKAVPDTVAFAVDDTTKGGFAIPTGSGNGWYVYTGPPNHWIVPIEERVFLIRTAQSRYAKVKFLSYYSDGEPPTQPSPEDSRYYTFKYVYQPNGSKSFE